MDTEIQTLLDKYGKEALILELQLDNKKQQALDFINSVYHAKKINEQEYEKQLERFKIKD